MSDLLVPLRSSKIQWTAFILIFAGCTTTQLNPSFDHVLQTPFQGWMMDVVMALLSGFDGVYTEASYLIEYEAVKFSAIVGTITLAKTFTPHILESRARPPMPFCVVHHGSPRDSSANGDAIRCRFLNFYASRGHKILPSASLVPDDPAVMLTIAGMHQFKPIVLGKEPREVPSATTAQLCIRTNDNEHVGRTSRHCANFDMLGNFNLAITSRGKLLFGHGSLQLRSMCKFYS